MFLIKKFKWFMVIIIPFLLSSMTYGEMLATKYQVGSYATSASTGSSGRSDGEQETSRAVLFETKLRQVLKELDKTAPDRDTLTKLSGEIEKLDSKITAEFSATEAQLRSKNASETILKRHAQFVEQYRENLEFLQDTLKPYDNGILGVNHLLSQVGVGSQVDQKAVKELKAKIRDKWLPQEFNPFKDGKFPKKNADFEAGEPDTSSSITPVYKLQAVSLKASSSTSADLAETIEVQLSPEIKALARELDYNPVKIFEYVRNNIDYAPYYGSVKGAQETLWQKAGNDFDQASLLIALYRASGIPARYVYGVVEIPVAKVKNWIGIDNTTTALNTFATNGIPAKAVMVGSQATVLRKEHVWVEAYVPLNHYRGSAADQTGKGWASLDPSFKQYEETAKMDLQSAVPFDAESFLQQLQSSAAIGDDGASVTGIDQDVVKQKLESYQQQVGEYLQQTNPNATLDNILGSRKIKAEKFGVLPLSMPYTVVSVTKELDTLTDSYRQAIKFWLENPRDLTGASQCVYTGVVPYIGSKRITLAYVAATQDDADLIASYLPETEADEMPSSLPAYLIKVKPQLLIDGEVVATGSAVTMGTTQKFYMDFNYPTTVGDPTETVENEVTAGAVYVVTLNTGKISADAINQRTALLKQLQKNIEKKVYDKIQSEELAGYILHLIGLTYFYKLDNLNSMIERSSGVSVTRMVSEAITFSSLKVGLTFGMPMSVSINGLGIDIDKDFYSVRSIDGDQQKSKYFFMTSGSIGSYLEGGIFEQMYGGSGVSTIHIFNASRQQGDKVFQVNSENVDSVLSELDYDSDKKQTIRDLIQNGKEVAIPEKSVTIGDWVGTGYMAIDPDDGTGAYMIDGGTSGGFFSDTYFKDQFWNLIFWSPSVGSGFIMVVSLLTSLIGGANSIYSDTMTYINGEIKAETTMAYATVLLIDIISVAISVFSAIVAIALVSGGFMSGILLLALVTLLITTLLTIIHSYISENYLSGIINESKYFDKKLVFV